MGGMDRARPGSGAGALEGICANGPEDPAIGVGVRSTGHRLHPQKYQRDGAVALRWDPHALRRGRTGRAEWVRTAPAHAVLDRGKFPTERLPVCRERSPGDDLSLSYQQFSTGQYPECALVRRYLLEYYPEQCRHRRLDLPAGRVEGDRPRYRTVQLRLPCDDQDV